MMRLSERYIHVTNEMSGHEKAWAFCQIMFIRVVPREAFLVPTGIRKAFFVE